jgi:hypothetical protein
MSGFWIRFQNLISEQNSPTLQQSSQIAFFVFVQQLKLNKLLNFLVFLFCLNI